MNRKAGSPLERRQRLLAWLFVAPVIAVVAVLAVYPLGSTVLISFTDAYLDAPDEAEWIGLKNYRTMLGDVDFRQAIVTTLLFTLASVSIEVVVGLMLALVVNAKFAGRGLMRGAMLIPWVLPTVVSARMWAWMLNDTYGVINDALVNRTGLLDSPVAWLANPATAFAALVAIDVWKTAPFMALLLLAGLQQISDDVYEAARVDGAGPIRTLWSVTLPLLLPALVVALIFRTLDALRVFDLIWVTTSGASGTEMMGTFVYRRLTGFSELGYGSALSVGVFAIIAVFVAAYLTALRIGERRS